MAYEMLMEQIKSVPQECLPDIENYIQFVLFKYNQNINKVKNENLSKFYGSVKFQKCPLKIQQEMRDEWN